MGDLCLEDGGNELSSSETLLATYMSCHNSEDHNLEARTIQLWHGILHLTD